MIRTICVAALALSLAACDNQMTKASAVSAFQPAAPEAGCANRDALIVVAALRAGEWTWDGYRMNGHGISIWYGNGDDSLGISPGKDSEPGHAFAGPCAKLIMREVNKQQEHGAAMAIRE